MKGLSVSASRIASVSSSDKGSVCFKLVAIFVVLSSLGSASWRSGPVNSRYLRAAPSTSASVRLAYLRNLLKWIVAQNFPELG